MYHLQCICIISIENYWIYSFNFTYIKWPVEPMCISSSIYCILSNTYLSHLRILENWQFVCYEFIYFWSFCSTEFERTLLCFLLTLENSEKYQNTEHFMFRAEFKLSFWDLLQWNGYLSFGDKLSENSTNFELVLVWT